MANDYKGVKLGIVMTNKNGKKTIKLGSSQEGDKAKYNYTVHLKVLDAEGNEVFRTSNPWVSLIKPKQRTNSEGEAIPSKVEYELQVFKD
jgi:hypothetical protein